MNLSHRARLWVLLFLAFAAPPALAQDTPSSPATTQPPPAHLSSIDGAVTLDRDAQSEPASAAMPLLPGDRLRTGTGRAEVLFTDGSALHLDQSTTADVLAGDLVRLIEGRVYILASGSRDPDRAVRYQIDAPAASVQTNRPGQYRVTSVNGQVELAVVAGEATLATEFGAVSVRAGERAVAQDGQAPSPPQYFNSARWDAFDRWSASRRDERIGTVSVQYLPTELSSYGSAFDQYGTWRSEPSVGYVWYPSVASDWRPYYDGYWQSYPSWGSVWIGSGPWDYPTHHYGRWGFSVGFGWYWIPGRQWGPAWVYWGTSAGYVSWCPLGYNDWPVFGMWGVHGSYYGPHHDPWHGWTVVPRHAFGPHYAVGRVAVDGRRLGPNARGGFVAHRVPPSGGRAVPRSWATNGPTPLPRGQRPPGSGGAFRPPAGGSANSGAVPRYGRGDGTGLARPIDANRTGQSDVVRQRRSVPGAGSNVFGSRPTPSEIVGAMPTPSAIIGSRPTPSQAVGARPRREVPSAPPSSSRAGEQTRAYQLPRAFQSSRTNELPRAYQPSRTNELPRAYQSPRTNEPPRAYQSPRTNELPRAYQSPRTNELPRAYQSPRTNELPRAYQPSRTNELPRGFQSPRTSDSPRSSPAPRSYESPRTSGAPSGGAWRAPSGGSRPSYGGGGSSGARPAAPRYNPGTASPRGGAPSGAPSRRR